MSVQLSPEQAAFLQGPVSINVSAVERDGWPCVTRAHGVIVARDRRALTILLSARRAHAVLHALDTGSGIAAAFTRPATHATLQFKAPRATRVTINAAHRRCNVAYAAAFAGEIGELGFDDDLVQGVVRLLTASDLVALRMVPEIAFDQTPGPAAGRMLATS